MATLTAQSIFAGLANFFMETGQLRYATDRVISSARHKDFGSQNLFDYILRRALSDALQSSA